MNQQNFQSNQSMNLNTEEIRRDIVIGSRRFSNYWWASVLLVGGIGFLTTGISSKLQTNLLPFINYQDIQFFPQGLQRGGQFV